MIRVSKHSQGSVKMSWSSNQHGAPRRGVPLDFFKNHSRDARAAKPKRPANAGTPEVARSARRPLPEGSMYGRGTYLGLFQYVGAYVRAIMVLGDLG